MNVAPSKTWACDIEIGLRLCQFGVSDSVSIRPGEGSLKTAAGGKKDEMETGG